MSSGSQETRPELLSQLVRELRQLNALGVSFFRAAAARLGMNATDVEVVDILGATGSMTAGRLAELTGLTTGAITQMLDRLEETGLVLRERDPDDGRRVIVRLAPREDSTEARTQEMGSIFESTGRRWDEIASRYDDTQLALLVEFLKQANAASLEEISRLREAPRGEGGSLSAPLGDLESARLVVSSGIYQLTLRAGSGMVDLYQAHFEGPVPDVKAKDGLVTIRYPRRLWVLGGTKRAARVTLNAAIPWEITIQGNASTIAAELGGLNLASLEIKGGVSSIRLDLPEPSGVVPIRIGGAASAITVRRPAGVAARAHLKGWAAHLTFDDQSLTNAGDDVRLQSPGYESAAQRYDIEISGATTVATITSG